MILALLQVIGIFGILAVMIAPLFIWAVWRSRRARQKLQAVQRLSKGYCPQCKYDFAGKANQECPECGYMLSPREFEKLESIQQVLQKVRDEA